MFNLKEELGNLENKGLKRRLLPLETSQGEEIVIAGKKCLNLCSNNYLGLANDLRLEEAAIAAIKEYGIGSGASRLVSGNVRLYEKLESDLAHFKGSEASLVFNSGYSANLGIISSLVNEKDIIFSDKLNHASIIDGIILSRAEFRRYAHKDMEMLEAGLKGSAGFRRRLIITDTVFSMDGDIAPLPKIAALAKKYQAEILVDEAHATGIFGATGSGMVEHFGLKAEIAFQMGTLSKAAGCFGAYISADKDAIDYFINRARSFIYTTSLPAAVLAASIKALEIIQAEPQRRKKLLANAKFFRDSLKKLGLDTLDSETQIIPVVLAEAVEFSRRLFKAGIFCSAIRPPTVPQNSSRLRITVMATHTGEQLEFALEKIKEIAKELGVI
ncbi:MAG: 8-amino-7-oxononanoate synthase [Candidatus Omnitrophica bacterium]|nr:8-amino-7-oxononanoate synthase [Candidatus Omnitrophota bacterium]MDD5237060.1 8-amino-7-oxononanoate synthase [Candidatus Omnitrophota bacterium]MDD5611221.1 8-amino-7-oxononanoate synthase [Candidatus Omnitrophota bacterium]